MKKHTKRTPIVYLYKHYKHTSPRKSTCVKRNLFQITEKTTKIYHTDIFAFFFHWHTTIAHDSHVGSEASRGTLFAVMSELTLLIRCDMLSARTCVDWKLQKEKGPGGWRTVLVSCRSAIHWNPLKKVTRTQLQLAVVTSTSCHEPLGKSKRNPGTLNQ